MKVLIPVGVVSLICAVVVPITWFMNYINRNPSDGYGGLEVGAYAILLALGLGVLGVILIVVGIVFRNR